MLTIQHDNKTYKVTKDKKCGFGLWVDSFVKSGALELIETKPEEKPTYWYIETEEMKKSEYWEVFKEWYRKKTNFYWGFGCDAYGFKNNNKCVGLAECDERDKLSPQQWYDTIYDGEKPSEHEEYVICPKCFNSFNCEPVRINVEEKPRHDKAMEIPEVPEFRPDFEIWEDSVTNSLNLLIKAHNNNL